MWDKQTVFLREWKVTFLLSKIKNKVATHNEVELMAITFNSLSYGEKKLFWGNKVEKFMDSSFFHLS